MKKQTPDLRHADDAFDKLGLGRFDYALPNIWRLHNHRRAIMASLVKGVYRMEKDRAKGLWKEPSHHHKDTARTPVWWQSFHYDMVRPVVEENGTGTVFAAVYRSRLHHPKLGAPKIVVAMRGTLLRRMDLDADIHILFHRLSSHQRFDMVLRVVREEVARFGPNCVCLAGHSKGAALALLVGRKLAEEGFDLEAHLFNPPHPSLPSQPMHLPDGVASTARIVHNVVANTLAHVLQHANTRNHEKDTFLAIRNWLPHLYINSQDPVCSSYIGYFEVNRHLPELKDRWFGFALSRTPRSIRGILRSYVGNTSCRPDHLIPSAYLHVNHVASSLQSAHQLHQWLDLGLQIPPPLTITFDAAQDCMTRRA